MKARAWSTPHVSIILGALLLLYFLASFTGLFFYEEQIPVVRLAVTLVIYIVIAVLIAHVNRLRGSTCSDSYGMGFGEMRTLILSPLIYLLTVPLMLCAAKVWHLCLQQATGEAVELQKVAQAMISNPAWLQILYMSIAILVTPFFEEIIFRGMLLPYLVKHTGLAGGTVLVSLLFALMHFHLPSFLPLLLLSAVLCLAYLRTGSLWVCVGMHAIFNTVSILALQSSY
jgi:membrane protease YdiL (CAAX protease family)